MVEISRLTLCVHRRVSVRSTLAVQQQLFQSKAFCTISIFVLLFVEEMKEMNVLCVMMFSITRGIYCTSVRPGRGIPHMWLTLRFLPAFYPVKIIFCSFSLTVVEGRGCHTLLKTYETNWDL